MARVNYKNLYAALLQQKKALELKLKPEKENMINEIPDDFNQNGWELTIEKLYALLEKLEELNDIRGNLLTPQWYRSIYNRCLIGSNEADKLIDKIRLDRTSLDFEKEVAKLNVQIVELQKQLSEKESEEKPDTK